jgi:hypothetical protein
MLTIRVEQASRHVRRDLQRLLDGATLGYEPGKVVGRGQVLAVLDLLDVHPEREPLRHGQVYPRDILTTRHVGHGAAGAGTTSHQKSVDPRSPGKLYLPSATGCCGSRATKATPGRRARGVRAACGRS